MTDKDLPTPDVILDVSGLNCPLPILRTRAKLNEMQTGDVLQVIATDPLAPLDFRAYCARTDNDLLDLKEEGETIHFLIRKG